MLGDNTGRSPKYLTYLTAVLGIKLHTNIIIQNLKSLHLPPLRIMLTLFLTQKDPTRGGAAGAPHRCAPARV